MHPRKLAAALALSGALAISAPPIAFAQTDINQAALTTDAGKGDDGKGKGPDLPGSGPGTIVAMGAIAAAVGYTLYKGVKAKGFTQ